MALAVATVARACAPNIAAYLHKKNGLQQKSPLVFESQKNSETRNFGVFYHRQQPLSFLRAIHLPS